MAINWNASKEDMLKVEAIVTRVINIAAEHGTKLNRVGLTMDVTACHLNGCPIDLEQLLTADRADFMHDVYGIQNHIDRGTGELLDCFLPRYTCLESVI